MFSVSFSFARSRGEDPGGLQGGVQPCSYGLSPAGHGAVCGEASPHRQAAAEDEGRRPQSSHLLPDGALPGHLGRLPHPAKVMSHREGTKSLF